MDNIIKIETRKGIETVNARELWEKLESKQQFADWIKGRIEKYGFVEGQDFTVHKIMKGKKGTFEANEYFVTLDMAKELAMVENNNKGRVIRQYFIAAEQENKSYKKIRGESKETRTKFTDTLQAHGLNKPHEYIQTTRQMKAALGIDKKKDDMNATELKIVTAAELIASAKLDVSDVYGYYECVPVCVETSRIIGNAMHARIK